MVKGISRQVIVVHAPDPKLFEQAIFILKDDAVGCEGITDDLLLQEAKRLVSHPEFGKSAKKIAAMFFGAACGAAVTGLFWALSIIF